MKRGGKGEGEQTGSGGGASSPMGTTMALGKFSITKKCAAGDSLNTIEGTWLTNQYKLFDRDIDALRAIVEREGIIQAWKEENEKIVEYSQGMDMSKPKKLDHALQHRLAQRDDYIRALNKSTLTVIDLIGRWRQAMVASEEFFWGDSNYLLKIPTDLFFLNNDRYIKRRFGVKDFYAERIPFFGVHHNMSWDDKDRLFTVQELADFAEATISIVEEEARFGWARRELNGRVVHRPLDAGSVHVGRAVGLGNNMTRMVRDGGAAKAVADVEFERSLGIVVKHAGDVGTITTQTSMLSPLAKRELAKRDVKSRRLSPSSRPSPSSSRLSPARLTASRSSPSSQRAGRRIPSSACRQASSGQFPSSPVTMRANSVPKMAQSMVSISTGLASRMGAPIDLPLPVAMPMSPMRSGLPFKPTSIVNSLPNTKGVLAPPALRFEDEYHQ
jgi:hypothetical protein